MIEIVCVCCCLPVTLSSCAPCAYIYIYIYKHTCARTQMNTDLGRGVRQRRHPAQGRVGGAEEQPALRGVEGGVADDVVLCVFGCLGVR